MVRILIAAVAHAERQAGLSMSGEYFCRPKDDITGTGRHTKRQIGLKKEIKVECLV